MEDDDREQLSWILADYSSILSLVVQAGTEVNDTSNYLASSLFRTNSEAISARYAVIEPDDSRDFGSAGAARARIMLERLRCGFSSSAASHSSALTESDPSNDRERGAAKLLSGIDIFWQQFRKHFYDYPIVDDEEFGVSRMELSGSEETSEDEVDSSDESGVDEQDHDMNDSSLSEDVSESDDDLDPAMNVHTMQAL